MKDIKFSKKNIEKLEVGTLIKSGGVWYELDVDRKKSLLESEFDMHSEILVTVTETIEERTIVTLTETEIE